jgi:hypothetical protein
MTNTTFEAGSAHASAPPMSLVSRFIGIITSPKATFESVAAHPRWLGMIAVTTLIIALGVSAPLTTEGGKQSQLDQQVKFMEGFGMQIGDQQYAAMQQGMGRAAISSFIFTLIGGPIWSVIVAGILFGVFAVMGGQARFKQLFAVYVHSGVVMAASQLFLGPLNYFRQSMSSATNLGVFNIGAEGSFLARFLGMIDLFVIWWVVVLAIGLAVLYKRRTQPIAITLFSIYGVIIIVFASIMSMFGRS